MSRVVQSNRQQPLIHKRRWGVYIVAVVIAILLGYFVSNAYEFIDTLRKIQKLQLERVERPVCGERCILT